MRKLVVTTPCSRPENLPAVHRSIFGCEGARYFDIEWHIVFDAAVVRQIPIDVVEEYAADPSIVLSALRSPAKWRYYTLINSVLAAWRGEDFWHYVLDDDNLLHPDLLTRIDAELQRRPAARGFIFSQSVGGNDFSGLEVRQACPANVAVSKIDQAQYLLHSSVIGDRIYPDDDYFGDGSFIVDVYHGSPDTFVFLDEVLSYYNRLRTRTQVALPRILVVGRRDIQLRSRAHAEWESNELSVECVENDDGAVAAIRRLDPDTIVTFGATVERFPSLFALPFDLRRRWIDVSPEVPIEEVGERAYACAMAYILHRNADTGYQQPLVSIFTSLHNTGEVLRRTYRSVAAQSYPNWEWVIVNDSPHGHTTLALAQEIARQDPRVKLHELHDKSGGIVGEAKYRAAMLCRGAYLLELDHDDVLTPRALDLMLQAFAQFPEAGFAYSDCAEVDDRLQSFTYPEGFAFGYGSYYQDTYEGVTIQVAHQHGINPKTIRHIVGVPNHFRAWRREVYHDIGGHNRRLSIADDYELVVRTFLATRMVHVPALCYLQFLSAERSLRNTQSVARADIQRRVRSIRWHYEEAIRRRFHELGLVDWASRERPDDPLLAPSRFGAEEQSASLEMTLPAMDQPYTTIIARREQLNVVVCGAPKSGTTALLYAVAGALEGEKQISYEPTGPEQIHFAPGHHTLCKIVFDGVPFANYKTVLPRFDRRLFIVRDPRDVLVSRLLFMVRDHKFIDDDERRQRLLDALATKEADPEAMDVTQLAELIGELEEVPDYLGWSIRRALVPMKIWEQAEQEGFHRVRYEDFVSGSHDALTEYLGFSIDHRVLLPTWAQHVTRTKSHGDWKNWFTKRDVEALRSRLAPYMEYFGYADAWDLPAVRSIDPQHASRYVAWIVDLKNKRRR